MRLYQHTIPAGESRTITARGKFIRGMAGNARYQIQIEGKAATDFETGIAMETADFFPAFRIINTDAAEQTIEVAVSDYPVDDNRLTAHLTAEGLLQVVTTGGTSRAVSTVTIPAATATKILSADTTRLKASVSISFAGRLGVDNTVSATVGFPVASGGLWQDENTGELWAYSTAGGSVDIIEDLK